MKTIRLILAMALGATAFSAQAQADFNDPRYASWGKDAEERKANLMTNSFLIEEMNNKNYDVASQYLNDLITKVPAASSSIYARGVVLYRNKINRARSLAEKKSLIDSVMLMHDMRLANFGNDPKHGAAYILDSKARLFAIYNKADREGLREVFVQAIEAGGDSAKADLVYLYFQNLCDDYQMDEVMADEVLAAYEKYSPFFDGLQGEDAEFKDKFEACFGLSGAASCENLEALFTKKLAAAPDDVDLLNQAVALMSRANCDSPFYVATAEKLYAIKPTANAAMALATMFQNSGEFDKASKYLTDALAEEQDMEAREALYTRISLVQLGASNMSKALEAARAALAIEDGTQEDNGVAYFVMAQAYASSAHSCGDFAGQAIYWVAYDTIAKALANFTAEEEGYVETAKKLMANYRAYFPTKETGFFNEVQAGQTYRITCGYPSGISTTARYDK